MCSCVCACLLTIVMTLRGEGTYRAIAPPVYCHCAAKINHTAFTGPPAQKTVTYSMTTNHMLHKKCPPSHCIDSALQILKAPNTSSVGAKPLYRAGLTGTLEPSEMDAPHTVRQNIPLSKAIDRTNIKESPSSVPLSPVCQSTPS